MRHESKARTWCMVLAAGDGSRLCELTTFGSHQVPKQFCAVGGETSLLGLALQRARRIVPDERIVAVVAAAHRRWWRDELADLPPQHVVVQPANRGTAAGVLLPLLRILAEDPEATVVLFPSDHYVVDEWTLATAALAALAEVRKSPQRLCLLGVTPDRPDPDLGWIVPARPQELLEAAPVAAFREKPPAAELAKLLRQGAVVNTFVLAARAATLADAYVHTLPDLLARFRRGAAGTADAAELAALYAELPVADFSRHILERVPERLSVIRVPACGWNDLGTPERVVRCFPTATGEPRPAASLVQPPARLRALLARAPQRTPWTAVPAGATAAAATAG